MSKTNRKKKLEKKLGKTFIKQVSLLGFTLHRSFSDTEDNMNHYCAINGFVPFPPKVINRIAELMDEEEFSDNERIAIVGDAAQELVYDKILAKGCCGFADVIEIIDGVEYKIGFNYGH